MKPTMKFTAINTQSEVCKNGTISPVLTIEKDDDKNFTSGSLKYFQEYANKLVNVQLTFADKQERQVEFENLYFSPRGFSLLDTQPLDCPLVTLERAEKWYSIYVIMPNESIVTLDPTYIRQMSGNDVLWIDHCYHPELLLRIARDIDGAVSPITLEMAAGRWVMESKSTTTPFSYFDNEG